MAAPFVTGIASLVSAMNPTFTDYQIKERIESAVNGLDGLKEKKVSTEGLVDAYRAIYPDVVMPKFTEQYTFSAVVSGGIRLYINNQLLIDRWTANELTEFEESINLEAGKKYYLKMEYYKASETSSSVNIFWASASQQRSKILNSFFLLAGQDGLLFNNGKALTQRKNFEIGSILDKIYLIGGMKTTRVIYSGSTATSTQSDVNNIDEYDPQTGQFTKSIWCGCFK